MQKFFIYALLFWSFATASRQHKLVCCWPRSDFH